MKKTLLSIFALALAAAGAMAQPSLTKNWEINSGVPGVAGGGDFRFMTAKDGKVLVTDKASKKIVAFDADGQTDYFDLTEALQTHYNGIAAGTLITTDDAGNILVNAGFSGKISGSNFIIISADLKNTYKLQITAPAGTTAQRIDQMGRIVGNMLSKEGAYMWLCYNEATNVAIIKVVNGVQDAENSQASKACAVAVNTSCVAQPVFNTVAEIDALEDKTPSFWFRNRSYPQNVYQWNSEGTEHTAISLTESTSGAYTANASQEGFEAFTLGNETYFVVPMTTNGETSGRGTNWGIYAASNKKLVATWEENPQANKSQGMGGFCVEKVDNNTVKIYHFLAGSVVGCYTFIDDMSVSVEETMVDANAPVEYYNLQGVKVENPSNGIFIKRQGAKATKVVL